MSFWLPIFVGGLLSGASCGILGTYIVGMRIPFLAISVAHAALAGAVFGALGGLHGAQMLWPALGAAVVAALLLGLLEDRLLHLDANLLIGVMFSLSMGLAFLGIGLLAEQGQSQNEVLLLLWGNLLYCQWDDVARIAGVWLLLAVFVLALRKEMSAILFSRLHAAAAGIPVDVIWTGFLILTSATLTVSFQTVGGLLIYSLVTNPAIAATQLVKGHDRTLLVSMLLGALSAVGGLWLAKLTDWPVGATIVILSSLLVVIALGVRRFSPPAAR